MIVAQQGYGRPTRRCLTTLDQVSQATLAVISLAAEKAVAVLKNTIRELLCAVSGGAQKPVEALSGPRGHLTGHGEREGTHLSFYLKFFESCI